MTAAITPARLRAEGFGAPAQWAEEIAHQLEIMATGDWPDYIRFCVLETGGTLLGPGDLGHGASHLHELGLAGVTATGGTLDEAIRNWKNCVIRASRADVPKAPATPTAAPTDAPVVAQLHALATTAPPDPADLPLWFHEERRFDGRPAPQLSRRVPPPDINSDGHVRAFITRPVPIDPAHAHLSLDALAAIYGKNHA